MRKIQDISEVLAGGPRAVVASALRCLVPNGVFARRARDTTPPQLLELFSMEGCPACRRVRVELTELDLDYVVRNCAKGARRNRDEVRRHGRPELFPYLRDPNTGIALQESKAIIAYLRSQYG